MFHAVAFLASEVGILDAQLGQDVAFELLHGLGLAFVLVVPAEQVQGAVDGEVGVVGGQRLALFLGLAGDDRRADHQVAEQWQLDALGRPSGSSAGKLRTLVA